MDEDNTEELIHPITKKIAIEFAIYCSSKMWDMAGFKYGSNTEQSWEEFIKEKKDGK